MDKCATSVLLALLAGPGSNPTTPTHTRTSPYWFALQQINRTGKANEYLYTSSALNLESPEFLSTGDIPETRAPFGKS
jgi:hypothetical protein